MGRSRARATTARSGGSTTWRTPDALEYHYPATLDYPHPATLDDYRPDPKEPVDRWFQAANSSNVRTTLRIIEDQVGSPAMIVDPFAGAGSAAVAARLLRVPFLGIEVDPVLACVTVAKALATEEHARQLAATPIGAATGDPIVRCLDLVRQLWMDSDATVDLDAFTEDLARHEPPVPGTVVIWGDATTSAAWETVPAAQGRPVIYCSPPFGKSSPRTDPGPALVDLAVRILRDAGLSRVATWPAEFDPYDELAAGMLGQAAAALGPTDIIMEYEPSDRPTDAERRTIVDQLKRQTDFRLTSMLTTKQFSSRGVLTLIVGSIGQAAPPEDAW